MDRMIIHSIRRGSMAAISAALLLAWAGTSWGEIHQYEAHMDSDQTVPPNNSPATGYGTFEIDDVANTVTYYIEVFDLHGQWLSAHIHGPASPGGNGAQVHTLPNGSPMSGVWNYDESLQLSILIGHFYVDVHSWLQIGGEIRGQILDANAVSCTINCPGGDDEVVNPSGGGNNSPDLNGDGAVTSADFAIFAGRYNTQDACADFDCSGSVHLPDFAFFAGHYLHSGEFPGVCE